MHVKPRVRPGEYAVGRLDIHEFPAHERTQHRTSKGLGECGDIVQGNRTNVPSARNPPSVMVKPGFTANQKNR